MRFAQRMRTIVCMLAFATMLLVSLSPATTLAASNNGGQGESGLTLGPVASPGIPSLPLHQPVNLPSQVAFAKHLSAHTRSKAAGSVCPAPTIDMRVLVIASDGSEADLPAIEQALADLGTPYTLYVAAQTPNGLTPDRLSNGCHGYYQGVILTNGALAYFNGTSWASALSQQEWTNLWSYELTMGVRELSWYTYPTADFGYQVPLTAFDTTNNPLAVTLASAAKASFPYLNSGETITIQNAYTYVAQPLTDGATTPFLTDANGDVLAAVRSYTDGRQVLSLTFDSNQYLLHDLVLSYGLINWVTNGMFLGERHVYMSPQVDDYFIDDTEWLPDTPCGTNIDNTGTTFRMSGSDVQALVKWQNTTRLNSVSANTRLTMAFNGYGATSGAYTPDTLTPATVANRSQFYWVSHTFDHTNLDSVNTATATSEIKLNVREASTLGLTLNGFNPNSMVTPDVSGLNNPSFLQAAYNQGIRFLVSDTSIGWENNPAPNVGIYNTYQPQILMLPRHPNNLFFNVTTPAEWVAEYNCIYSNFWGRNLSYQEILDKESQVLLSYLLQGDLDPWMFHQPNLRAYDGTHSLLSDLLDMTLQKYAQYYNLPIESPSMDQLGMNVSLWMQYLSAGVTASYTPGVSITLTAQKSALVPVTGLNVGLSELYGGQHISYVLLPAGKSITLRLNPQFTR